MQIKNLLTMHFPVGFADKAFPIKTVLDQSPAPIVERQSSYMRSLAIIVLMCILLGKAASGVRRPDWETCEFFLFLFLLLGAYYFSY